MKTLIDYYLEHQNYASKRTWDEWPFHNIYNYYESQNGNMTCKEKWRNLVDANLDRLKNEADFDRLYSELAKLAVDVRGIGALHIYDTATCFLQPTTIHLNCGAHEAAKAIKSIKIKNGSAAYDDFVAYDKELARLTPLQLEDFLCINKKVFNGILTPQQQLEIHRKKLEVKSTCKANSCPSAPKPSRCNR